MWSVGGGEGRNQPKKGSTAAMVKALGLLPLWFKPYRIYHQTRIGHSPGFTRVPLPSQIGPASQRADQSALAVRGPVGRAGPPKETEGWGPLLSGAWHICIYTPWVNRLVRRQTSRGHVTRSQSMPESTLERQTGCESFALGIGGHIPRPRTTRSRGPSSR